MTPRIPQGNSKQSPRMLQGNYKDTRNEVKDNMRTTRIWRGANESVQGFDWN